MDHKVNTRHNALERILLDENAEPTDLPLSLLEDITKCFSEDQQIGSGGFAVVYKGMVGNGMVAVKKLSRTFDMHENKFHKEIECLVKAKHKNIVRFLGYCSDTQGKIADYEGKLVMADVRNWLLCFEYVPNGSLDKYITDVSRGLEWRERYKIIMGICEGLRHLHVKRILHLDLKPSNILIDDHMVPKIADFGLSRCLDQEQTRAFTSHLCGSQGYLAPEFYRGEIAFASDIYSLGVIIMEILTGEKGFPEHENVAERWMNRLRASDQRDTQLEQVRVCTKIGTECMDLDPKKRPAARDIVDRLDKTITADYSEETAISSLVKLQIGEVVTKLPEKNKVVTKIPRKKRGVKHAIPSLDDDLWRLKKISRNGVFHEALNASSIFRVKDFLRLYYKDEHALRKILKKATKLVWTTIIDHAKMCDTGNELYSFVVEGHDVVLFFDSFHRIVGLTSSDLYTPFTDLDKAMQDRVREWSRVAYDTLADRQPDYEMDT